MNEIKDKNRHILVPFDFSAAAENALKHGLKICYALKSNLALCYFHNTKDTETEKKEVKDKLGNICAALMQEHQINITAFVPTGKLNKLLSPLSEKIEAVMVVFGFEGEKFIFQWSLTKVLRNLRKSRIPFLTVPVSAVPKEYTHIILPINYMKGTKEKIIWASYFSRLNQSTIHVIVPKAKDGNLRLGVKNNIDFLKKNYKTLNVYYKKFQTDVSINKIDKFSVCYAVEHNADSVLALATNNIDIFDVLFGTKERKIILNEFMIPVLCINPRNDMYVLCA